MGRSVGGDQGRTRAAVIGVDLRLQPRYCSSACGVREAMERSGI